MSMREEPVECVDRTGGRARAQEKPCAAWMRAVAALLVALTGAAPAAGLAVSAGTSGGEPVEAAGAADLVEIAGEETGTAVGTAASSGSNEGPDAAGAAASTDAGLQAVRDAIAAADARDADGSGEGPDTSVTAYVNGEALSTSLLTDYIDGVRATIGSQTNAAWEAYLADQGCTPDEYWAGLIAHYAREMVLTQRADELGLKVGEGEVDERIAQIKESLGVDGDDGAFLWQAYLDTYGLTEESLRANQAYYLMREKLYEAEVEAPEVDEGVLQSYADAYGYLYGAAASEDGTVDLAQVDDDTLERLRAGARAFAWDCACDAYASDLLAQADLEVVVAHQYDVPGQDRDAL